MAELGLAVAQTLSAALQCSELKAICSVCYKSQLEELNKTVTTIKNELLDAETKLLSNEQRGYIKELNDVVYEADDLFDEFLTRLELKQRQGSKGGNFYKKVRFFFSSDESRFSQAYRMFKKVKEIQTKLNSIVDNHKRFALGVDYKPICLRGEETCSYIDVKGIIGRNDDKKVVVKMFLESKNQDVGFTTVVGLGGVGKTALRGEETCSYADVKGIIGRNDDKKVVVKMLLESKNQDVGFTTVVGLGGVGKTALAQLVYNDKDIQREFGFLRFWVCVADQDKQKFDVKVILSKILKEVTKGQRSFDAFELQQLQNELQKELRGKKYMLVLDDVWNEDRAKWVGLQKFLMFGERGSRVLVTTRSEMTAGVVGDDDHTYKLQGLSRGNSWDLFKMVAFNQGNYQPKEFVEVGEKIVSKCSNIPLAITIVGGLLYGQNIKKWKLFQKIGLSKIEEGDNQIMSVLKLSCYNLKSSLKSCFTYCAIFPKDYRIEKVRLVNLWMAQGYIVSADQGGQSIADVAEEYFMILVRRCFFQDVVKDYNGYIKTVKIHDLMHDVAQEMAGKEIQIHEFGGNNIGDEVRHWSFDGEGGSQISSSTTKLRSYIDLSFRLAYKRSQLVPNQLKCLRVLALHHLDDIKSLESIGELLHLRYLDLSFNKFEAFPCSSITKLHNLQTFILFNCIRLRKLPHDFSKLKKLIYIKIECCFNLRTMPSLSKLPYLKSLELVDLYSIEYMEETSSFAGAEETPFFPSLEYLHITGNNKLRGCFGAEVHHCQSIRRFPCLSRLVIEDCPMLVRFPSCPTTLSCDKLRIVKQVVGKGTSCLATLALFNVKIIELEDDIMLWEALNQSLRTLIFANCEFKILPKGMRHLTSLQTLKILRCSKLNALPKWISYLTSLQDLQIRRCSRLLYKRCNELSKADWPKIQHIPSITIGW